jgi:hypothetical protein
MMILYIVLNVENFQYTKINIFILGLILIILMIAKTQVGIINIILYLLKYKYNLYGKPNWIK